MMFSFSGTVMTCTCSSTVTWLYLFLYCYLIYLTTPSAFLNGKVHDLDLVLAYVYQNVLLTFHFQLMYLLLNLILTLAYNPCDLYSNPTLFAYVLFQPPPWTCFSQPPSFKTYLPWPSFPYSVELFPFPPDTIFTCNLSTRFKTQPSLLV